ncbi:MAG: endonuclease/exonuclease/phosphatase family protein [Alistipes senegalensis]
MKKTIRYLLSGLALLALGACTSSDNEDGSGGNDGGLTFVTVVSFNIRVDNADDGDNAWDNRKPASAAMVRRERPTVMGLQEAQRRQITYLARNCPDYAWYGLGREQGVIPPRNRKATQRGVHRPFYLEQIQLLDKGTFWLSQTPDIPSKGWDAAYNRTCTWGLFGHKACGKRFYHLNTHLDHQGATAREESIKLIASKIKQFNTESYPVFLTADLIRTRRTIFSRRSRQCATRAERHPTRTAKPRLTATKPHPPTSSTTFLFGLHGLPVQNPDRELRCALHLGPLP